MEVKRPSQHKQPSRKGKRTWIKNIDLDDLEEGLEENRDNLIKFGVEGLNELNNDNLFIVDTKGDSTKKPSKILKSTEILNKRSKVPELKHYHHKKERISKDDFNYLMSISGRNKLESSTKAEMDRKGLVKTKAYNVWDLEETDSRPEVLQKNSITSWTKPSKAPKTLKEESIIVEEVSSIPDAGRSYNPSLDDWKSLILKEFTNEQERDEIRTKLEDQLLKVKNLIKNINNNVEEDSESENEEEKEEQAEENEEDKFKLSLNKPVEIKRKTRRQRNKAKRHQERIKLESEVRELKSKIKQLENVYEFTKIKATSKKNLTNIDKIKKRKKLGTKHKVVNQNLDIKLSDELSDSLRSLKPEGNLLQDTMFNLQSKGKIETRIPLNYKRKYKHKITEKWSYKDFK